MKLRERVAEARYRLLEAVGMAPDYLIIGVLTGMFLFVMLVILEGC